MFRKIFLLAFLICWALPAATQAGSLPAFLSSKSYQAIFPKGVKKWKPGKNVAKGENGTIQWQNSRQDRITLQYRAATPENIHTVFRDLREELREPMGRFGSTIITVEEFFVAVQVNDDRQRPMLNVLYATPSGAYQWQYSPVAPKPAVFKTFTGKVTFAAREHQYEDANKLGSEIMARWEKPVYEFAQLLLAGRNDARAETVYMDLLQAVPTNNAARMEFATLIKDPARRLENAAVILEDAEKQGLLETAASILKQETPAIQSYPLLASTDKGLKVILIPITNCNPWVLDETAALYQTITSIPVVIRRLPDFWNPAQPAHSKFRPALERLAARLWPGRPEIKTWSFTQLKEELMKSAQADSPAAVANLQVFLQRMEETGNQWSGVEAADWLAKIVKPEFSKDGRTMVVGITELDFIAPDRKPFFSLYQGTKQAGVGIVSYARMAAEFTGENPSRKRLVERAAKELVRASLPKLGIPASIDPTCPYSVADTLARLDEKTVNLSIPVKKKLKEIGADITI